MKTRYTKREMNLYCMGYLIEYKKILWRQGEKSKELEQIINQLNNRLERQARRNKK